MKFPPIALALSFLCLAPAVAQKKDGQLPERTEAEILATVKLPEGYEATVFARPPQGGYPISVSAAIDGTIFLAQDENGSLGRDRNTAEKKPGRIVRLRDTDGDGRADEFKTFCEVESPRGVIWDGVPRSRGALAPGLKQGAKAPLLPALPATLYVMHPPNLTAYTDTDGDGVSDKQEDILTGLGFGLDFRGADHTTNGCRLAIDGFIYIAVGDYGFIGAKAKDGTTLTNRGGGIVRIRPDGTGFEIVSRGQRNIYDVAVSPTLDLFTRDNTNDGGGWNVRLSHVPPGAHLGYPTLFINFPEDHLPPLADYGGGSPCGALWLDEPGLPSGLFTVEWGRNAIMQHTLKPKGAGFELVPGADPKSPGQQEWIKLTRPTDMDVDATGALFITSWEGATFNYNGPFAGYVLRVVKKGAEKVKVPDLAKATAEQLLTKVKSPSAALRLAAVRELLRRKLRSNGGSVSLPGTVSLTLDANTDLQPDEWASRLDVSATMKGTPGANVAAYYAAVQLVANGRTKFMNPALLYRSDTRAAGARCIGDYPSSFNPSVFELLVGILVDDNADARAAAITALRRLGKADAAPSILPLVADEDPVIAHLAVRALSELKAAQVCLAALDRVSGRVGVPPAGSGVPPEQSSAKLTAIADGALRALYGMYETDVVDGLIARLDRPSTGSGESKDRSGETPKPAGGTPTLPGNNATAGTGAFELRRGILNALCRLDNQDAPYANPGEWWSTRPDTSGPVYKPQRWAESDKIEAALKKESNAAQGEDARWLVQRMYLTKVNFPGLVEQMLAACGNDTPARLTAIEGMFRSDHSLPPEAVAALGDVAEKDGETPELRARALRLLQKGADHGSVFPTAFTTFAPFAGHDLPHAALTAAFEDFSRDAKNGKWIGDYAKALAGKDAAKRQFAATVLVNLATSRVAKEKERDAAKAEVEKAFAQPEPAAALLAAIARTGAKPYAEQVKANLNNPNNAVAEAALFAFQKLGLKDTGAPSKMIGEMKYEEVFAAVQKGGDAKAGSEMFLKAACIACHTITADEPPKGPILSAVAKIYDRAALTESLLKPSAKMAQGFESQWFKTKSGEQIEGFVTREGGDSLDVRNIAGQTVTIEKADLAERGHRPQSMMPEGLLNAFTPVELANLLAWLESLRK